MRDICFRGCTDAGDVDGLSEIDHLSDQPSIWPNAVVPWSINHQWAVIPLVSSVHQSLTKGGNDPCLT
jgi:hypothetical protein